MIFPCRHWSRYARAFLFPPPTPSSGRDPDTCISQTRTSVSTPFVQVSNFHSEVFHSFNCPGRPPPPAALWKPPFPLTTAPTGTAFPRRHPNTAAVPPVAQQHPGCVGIFLLLLGETRRLSHARPGQARPGPPQAAMQGPARRAQPAPRTTHAEPQLWPARHPFPLPTFSPLPAVVPGQEKPPMSLRQTPGSAQCARAAEGGVRRPRYTHTLVVPPHVAALFIRGQVPVPAHKLIEELGGRYHRELRAESPSPDTSSAHLAPTTRAVPDGDKMAAVAGPAHNAPRGPSPSCSAPSRRLRAAQPEQPCGTREERGVPTNTGTRNHHSRVWLRVRGSECHTDGVLLSEVSWQMMSSSLWYHCRR